MDDRTFPYVIRPLGWLVLLVGYGVAALLWPLDRLTRWRDPD